MILYTVSRPFWDHNPQVQSPHLFSLREQLQMHNKRGGDGERTKVGRWLSEGRIREVGSKVEFDSAENERVGYVFLGWQFGGTFIDVYFLLFSLSSAYNY